MPCGPRARLTAYVAYQALAFAERDVLLAALADGLHAGRSCARGYRGKQSRAGARCESPRRRGAALVIRREHLPAASAISVSSSATELRPARSGDARAEPILEELRTRYGRAKAGQLAEQARRRYRGSVHRTVAADGSMTIRVRF